MLTLADVRAKRGAKARRALSRRAPKPPPMLGTSYASGPDSVALTLPIATVNELNEHQHWRTRQRRAADQHRVMSAWLTRERRLELPVVVSLTRSAPSAGLDVHDGLPASFKHVADAIALWLGVDDKTDLIEWRYAQERGPWGVRVRIARRA